MSFELSRAVQETLRIWFASRIRFDPPQGLAKTDDVARSRLVPELDVTDLSASLRFYVELGGFEVRYERPEERFVYLARGGAELMLQEAEGPGRRFRSAPLERPFGRGLNLQIEVRDVASLAERLAAAGFEVVLPLEERWYRVGKKRVGQRQFVVADPDGYLIRYAQGLGERSLTSD